MILVHLSMNGKAALVDEGIIQFAEEFDTDKKNKSTRLYLKESIKVSKDEEINVVDVEEEASQLYKMITKMK